MKTFPTMRWGFLPIVGRISLLRLVPSLLSDQRHEAHFAEWLSLLRSRPFASFVSFDQLLVSRRGPPTGITSRPPGANWSIKRLRHMASARRGEDGVVGRSARSAAGAVAVDDRDIAVAVARATRSRATPPSSSALRSIAITSFWGSG